MLEVQILREKLTQAEDQLVLVRRALWESDMKVHNVMTRLLVANDVNKGTMAFWPMRSNILEQMNDLRRNIRGFFANVGITLDANSDHGREI